MASCDLQAAQRIVAAASSLCFDLNALVTGSTATSVDVSAFCANPSCLEALRELRSLRLDGCALRGAASLHHDVLDACVQDASLSFDTKQLSTGAAVGLGLTLFALFMCLVLICSWVRRSRRKHPLQLLSPVRMPSRRVRGVPKSVSGISGSVPYTSIELSEEELREKACKK